MTTIAVASTLLLWTLAIAAVLWRWLTADERPEPDARFFTRRERLQMLFKRPAPVLTAAPARLAINGRTTSKR